MSRPALVREADLRRWAKIAREEGVAIVGSIDPKGGVVIRMTAAAYRHANDADDLDARLDEFGAM